MSKSIKNPGNYLEKVNQIVAAKPDLPIGVHIIVVEHHVQCRFHTDGNCTCDAKVTLCEGNA